jgi:hypothetical protein
MPELSCEGCGRSLQGESFHGPPLTWWANEGAMSIIAASLGWAEGRCPDCIRED